MNQDTFFAKIVETAKQFGGFAEICSERDGVCLKVYAPYNPTPQPSSNKLVSPQEIFNKVKEVLK